MTVFQGLSRQGRGGRRTRAQGAGPRPRGQRGHGRDRGPRGGRLRARLAALPAAAGALHAHHGPRRQQGVCSASRCVHVLHHAVVVACCGVAFRSLSPLTCPLIIHHVTSAALLSRRHALRSSVYILFCKNSMQEQHELPPDLYKIMCGAALTSLVCKSLCQTEGQSMFAVPHLRCWA